MRVTSKTTIGKTKKAINKHKNKTLLRQYKQSLAKIYCLLLNQDMIAILY
jgi:hypothetical protein